MPPNHPQSDGASQGRLTYAPPSSFRWQPERREAPPGGPDGASV